MSNKRRDCSNLTVGMPKKNGGKYVANVTDSDIPYMERAAIKVNINHKRNFQSFSFTGADTDITLCCVKRLY